VKEGGGCGARKGGGKECRRCMLAAVKKPGQGEQGRNEVGELKGATRARGSGNIPAYSDPRRTTIQGGGKSTFSADREGRIG